MIVQTHFGDWYDQVLVDGNPLSPERSQQVWNHSPDGFSWSYGGSGCAQLALGLLLEAGLDEDTAVRLHQDFKFATVATWPRDGDNIHEIDVEGWVAEHGG